MKATSGIKPEVNFQTQSWRGRGREEGGREATVQPTGLDIFGRHYGEFPALEDHGTAEDYN